MSNSITVERIRRNPKFQILVARRSRLSWLFVAIALSMFYALVFVVAFQPGLLHTPIAEGKVVTVGWPIGAAIIIVSWLLTGWYVHRANSEFDSLNKELLAEALS